MLAVVLGDWQINGIYSAFSGTPFTITADGATVNAPGNLQTADQTGRYRELGAKGSAGLFFDTSSFAQPRGVRFGNTGRNAFRGPGQWNLDCSILRGFSVGDTRRVELRAEFFNVTNTPKWRNPRDDRAGYRRLGRRDECQLRAQFQRSWRAPDSSWREALVLKIAP